jgi:hypothetical protein
VSRREVCRLLRLFEHVRKPAYPVRHLNEVQVARAVTLIQEGWTFRHVAMDLSVTACGIATMRYASSQEVLDKAVDA